MIEYTGIELFPLPTETIQKLNFENILDKEYIEVFYQMHELEWNKKTEITPLFSLQKIQADLNSISLTGIYDLVYFDAFGPDVQPEIWSLDNFRKIYHAMNNGGILVTYSSKGIVKNNLRNTGFDIIRLQGPPGKRHMIRAVKL